MSRAEKRSRKGYRRLGDDRKNPRVLVHTINGNQMTSMRKGQLEGMKFGTSSLAVLNATNLNNANENCLGNAEALPCIPVSLCPRFIEIEVCDPHNNRPKKWYASVQLSSYVRLQRLVGRYKEIYVTSN